MCMDEVKLLLGRGHAKKSVKQITLMLAWLQFSNWPFFINHIPCLSNNKNYAFKGGKVHINSGVGSTKKDFNFQAQRLANPVGANSKLL